ncbi:MAG: hypothetical protein IH840_04755 [Candidatus Heimdallarchaeota archaeon]|nr:hypothetical protein [Candidatus Heimdallarchaeota archaeon]
MTMNLAKNKVMSVNNITYPNHSLTQGLIEAHRHTRMHIRSLYEGITQDQWVQPVKGPWNFRSLGVEILNFEIKMINKVYEDQFDEVKPHISMKPFFRKFTEVSNYMVCAMKYEERRKGFQWITDESEKPSMPWVLMRTNAHDIYHAGGITVIREHLGIERADYANWSSMADAPFLVGFGN